MQNSIYKIPPWIKFESIKFEYFIIVDGICNADSALQSNIILKQLFSNGSMAAHNMINWP